MKDEIKIERQGDGQITLVCFCPADDPDRQLALGTKDLPALGEPGPERRKKEQAMEHWGDEVREHMLRDHAPGPITRLELDLLRELALLECRLRTPHTPLNRGILRWHGWRGSWHARFAKAREITEGILARGMVEEAEAQQLQVVRNLYPYYLDAQVAQASLFANHGDWDEAAAIVSWLLEMLPEYRLPMELAAGEDLRQALQKLVPPMPPEGFASLKELTPPSPPPKASPTASPLRPDEIHRLLRTRLGTDEWLRTRGQLCMHLLCEGLTENELLNARIETNPFLLLMLPDESYLKLSSTLFSLLEHIWLLGSCAPNHTHDDKDRPLLINWNGKPFDKAQLDTLLKHWAETCGVANLGSARFPSSLNFEADRRQNEL